MVLVEGGAFLMGCREKTGDCPKEELPVHEVTVPSFMICKFEVTHREWEAVMGAGHSAGFPMESDECPEAVAYNDALKFIAILNRAIGLKYRLPTESEWEFAARGGNHSKGYLFAGSNDCDEVGWYQENASKPRPVGLKKPNELGLFDMTGNLFEWTQDSRTPDYLGAPDDGSAYTRSLGSITLRGGSVYTDLIGCRISWRTCFARDHTFKAFGFRLVREL